MGRTFVFQDATQAHEIKTLQKELLVLDRYAPRFANFLYPYHQKKRAPFYFCGIGDDTPILFSENIAEATFRMLIEDHTSFVQIGEERILFSDCIHNTIMHDGLNYERFLMVLRMSDTPLRITSEELAAIVKEGLRWNFYPETWNALCAMQGIVTIADEYTEGEEPVSFTYRHHGLYTGSELLRKLEEINV